jgi:hypothetical protein
VAAADRDGDNAAMSDEQSREPDQPEWIPLDENPHADDKRDVLDPTGEGQLFKRLIVIGLGIGVVVVALVVWLV